MRKVRKESGVGEKVVDVVVVEDDDDSRTMLVVLLETNDCMVRSFANAEDAFAASQERVPDVIIADLHLSNGGATGWTLAEMLRREGRTAHVALIAITGQVEPRMEVVRAFDAYVRKPAEANLVVMLVGQLAAVSRAQRRERRTTQG
jgi:two-component system nitrogen regulation response regulator NtrX